MRKKTMTLAAVLCCSLTMFLFSACIKEETKKTGYTYDMIQLWYVNNENDEFDNIFNAFKEAIGITGGSGMLIHYSIKDDEMKAACESVVAQYANAKSTYLMYGLVRNTESSNDYRKDTIAFFAVGQALDMPFSMFKYDDHEHDFIEQMRAIRDSIGEEAYQTCRRTFTNIHRDYINHLGTLNKYIADPANETTQRVLFVCDSLANVHMNDSLFIDLNITINKTILLLNETSQIWNHTFHANL